MKLYHASKLGDLERTGLQTGTPTLNNRLTKSQKIYLGTLNYVKTQYARYTKPGTYYIYEVDTEGLDLEEFMLGEQWRTGQNVAPGRLKKIETFQVTIKGF
jgi:hypothetical protein